MLKFYIQCIHVEVHLTHFKYIFVFFLNLDVKQTAIFFTIETIVSPTYNQASV